jgi:hypothetical protein
MKINLDPTQHIYQIFYDEKSRNNLDPDFIPYDNQSNLRPDWREYWPIRQYLLSQSLSENSWYGFLSPKFFQKTGLRANQVSEFISNKSEKADVVIFSPYFDQSAFFINIFEQGAINHPKSIDIFSQCTSLIYPGINIHQLVMDSRSTIFCNFIIGKPKFWRLWLEKCELIFAVAEANKNSLDVALNQNVRHDTTAALKTFMIERVASLLFATEKSLNVKAYPPINLPFSNSRISEEREWLICLDALKIAYLEENNLSYLDQFYKIRSQLLSQHNN